MQLFGKRWSLTVGTSRFSDPLRVQFHAKKTVKPTPNTLDMDIYNLAPQHRLEIERAASLPCLLEAGYIQQVMTIFLGDVRSVTTRIEGPDVITTLASGDGEKLIRGKRVNVTIGAQAQAGTVLAELATALGVAPGNLAQAQAMLAAKGQATLFPKGVAIVGNAWREMQAFARSAGLEVSIQDGALYVLDAGRTLDSKALVLRDGAGLIGSPSVDADGTIQFEAQMLPDLKPGVLVSLQAFAVNGFYRVEQIEYKGDTAGEEWGALCHAKPLTPAA